MADPVPLTFTTYNVGMSHVRRAGERFSVCGVYVWLRASDPETLLPQKPICEACSLILAADGGMVPGIS